MIGLLCATPEELPALRARLSAEPAEGRFGPTRVWTGEHAGQPFALALCGLGKVNAAAAATLLLSVFGAKTLVFAGVAGGLNPELPVGAVLLADRLAIHDYGLVAAGEFIPTLSGELPIDAERLTTLAPVAPKVAADLTLLAQRIATALGDPIRLGGLVTADYFLNCVETRQTLHATFGADAIDMESGAVAQVAAAWDAPLYVIRTLSDLAGEDSHLTYPEMAAMAARNSALCVLELFEIFRAHGDVGVG
ncbi:MAG: 5'-methylthioadenosine/S-adenosylhomocysteine nucleosidase [Phenylobacterium sp.]|uniref:5'-methylthioadenosine/S-adenosylhomocysteine nucleosidase n=1 Tax=Phenylobacterium sp. TaxID=1871053 RepID=UPI00273551CC|nr:5'-methylthioadenosine/S-adenosylhomocysteine nucleosidase [Phenylobacterium sp.]MDP3175017.1 5'-methylthioadenosine/S-adenosylhomocysteine nucleosidase [Phenylobacterium sp.]